MDSPSKQHLRLAYRTAEKYGPARYLLGAAIFTPPYLALDWASYIEPLGSFNITPWNPGPALAIVWMLRAGLDKAPVVFAATFIADIVVRGAAGNYTVTFLNALAFTIGYSLIAVGLREFLGQKRSLRTIREADGFLDSGWLDARTLEPTGARPLGPDVVRVRAWVNPDKEFWSELVVEAIPEALFHELQRAAKRAIAQGSRFLFEFTDESAAEKALDRVRASGGRIRSFVPKRKSLEDLLLEGLDEERKAR